MSSLLRAFATLAGLIVLALALAPEAAAQFVPADPLYDTWDTSLISGPQPDPNDAGQWNLRAIRAHELEWEHVGFEVAYTFAIYPGTAPNGSLDTLLVSGVVYDSLGSRDQVIYRRGLTEVEWTDASEATIFFSSAVLPSGCVLFGKGSGARGIIRSCNGGRTWTQRAWPDGDHIHVDCLYPRPSDGAVLGCYEDADDLVISTDDGLTWTLLGVDFPGDAGLAEHSTAAPGGGPRLVAGLQGFGYAYPDGGGLNWTPSTAWNRGQYLPDDLAIDPPDGTEFDGRLYAMNNDGLSPDPRMGEALLASDDGAAWWLGAALPDGVWRRGGRPRRVGVGGDAGVGRAPGLGMALGGRRADVGGHDGRPRGGGAIQVFRSERSRRGQTGGSMLAVGRGRGRRSSPAAVCGGRSIRWRWRTKTRPPRRARSISRCAPTRPLPPPRWRSASEPALPPPRRCSL